MRIVAATLLFALTATAGAAENFCDRSGSKSTPSPDGRWIAHVQEEVCATANGAAAGITVLITSVADPEQSKRVFIMPVPRSKDDWPRVQWNGTHAIELRVPNLAEPSPPEPEFAGIRITMAYCGDNPAHRDEMAAYKAAVKQWQKDVTAWADLRKREPEAAGARPPRPTEPNLPRGRCVD